MKIKRLLYRSNILLILVFLICGEYRGQGIANYVTNGSFEQIINCVPPQKISRSYGWRSLDSINGGPEILCTPCFSNVPDNGFTYQLPRTGSSQVFGTLLCQPTLCATNNSRSYFRNRLKSNLQAGKTYCVKFYVNNSDNSSHGIDGFGAYFGDNSLDTITVGTTPLTYLNPQIQNVVGNIISDTLNWTLVTGTFVATGVEKHVLIGNFKDDANTNTSPISHWPAHFNQFSICTTCVYMNVMIDDVSCIPIDLPAYAGPNMFIIPGNTVYIGRPQDVGIDEACTWYNITNTNTPIGTAAGITVSPTITSTYIVKQDICGNIRWDTVTVYMSGVGLNELELRNKQLKISPNPVKDFFTLTYEGLASEFTKAEILNCIGQLVKEVDLNFSDKQSVIDIQDVPAGAYLINLKGDQSQSICKRFIIVR